MEYHCDKCNDLGGKYYRDENGYLIWQKCGCIKVKKALARFKMSGLGEMLKLYTFDKFKTEFDWQKDAYKKAIDFVNSENKWFVMSGQSGAGKSHLCTAIVRELLLKQEKGFKFMQWIDESNRLKRNMMDNELYDRLMNELKEIEVLYIDDFFKSENNTKPTSADIKLANEILNYRYNVARISKERFITIISTERTIGQLMEYDEALAGRIIEMTKPNNFIQLIGKEKNYRLKSK